MNKDYCRFTGWTGFHLLVISLFLPLQTRVQAQLVLADNLANTASGFTATFNAFGNAGSVAEGFTPAQAATLQTVTLAVPSGNGGGGFTVSVYSDAGGTPGSPLVTLSGSSDPSSPGNYDYTGSLALSAHVPYWIVASVSPTPNTSIYEVNVTANSANAGSAILTGEATDLNGGAWTVDSSHFVQMRLTAVPEPSQWAAVTALALAGFAFSFRRRGALSRSS